MWTEESMNLLKLLEGLNMVLSAERGDNGGKVPRVSSVLVHENLCQHGDDLLL